MNNSSARRADPRPTTPCLAVLIAGGLVLAVFALGRLGSLGSIEDAYITYRCAQNLADGHGLVFNPGERVESTSAFLFAVVLAGLAKLPKLTPEIAAPLLNHLALWFVLAVLLRGVLDRRRDRVQRYVGLAAVAYVAFNPATIYFAHAGMETVFFGALVFAGFVLAVASIKDRSPAWAAGLVLALAAAVRMEALGFALLTLPVLYAARRRWSDAAWFALGVAAVFGPILALRWTYYGYPFPNAYYAKVDGGNLDLLWRGGIYTLKYMLTNPPALAALAACVYLASRQKRAALPAALGATWIGGYIAYNIFVGGDYFPMLRFYLPLLPVVAYLLAHELPRAAALLPNGAPGWLRRPTKLLAALVLFSFAATWLMPPGAESARRQVSRARMWRAVGLRLAETVPPETVLMAMAAGAVPYYSKLRTYDSIGLADAELAHREKHLGTKTPGHDFREFGRVHETQPDVIIVTYLTDDPDVLKGVERFLIERAAARRNPPRLLGEQRRLDMLAAYPTALSLASSKTMARAFRPMELDVDGLRLLVLVRDRAPYAIKQAFTPFRLKRAATPATAEP